MRVHLSCFGLLPTASSRRPIKRYNLLVPDIFPRTEPPFQDKVDSSIDRKIKKLADYLDKNPHRGPKVSRRLARKIQKELRAQRYGYVKLATRAYMHLLEALKNDDSSLFAKEIVVQPVDKHVDAFTDKVGGHLNSVVGLLLRHNKVEIRTLGASLLAQFEKVQVDSDYVDQLEQFVPLVCANCEAHPVGLYDPSPKDVSALNMVCMQALRQHLALAHRVSFTSHHLEQMMNVTLDTLAQPGSDMDMADGSGDGIEGSQPVDPPYRHSLGKQPLSDAVAGSTGDGPAVGSTDRVSAISGAAPLSYTHTSSRPSALHHSTGATCDARLQHKHMPEDKHVQIVEASSRNGVLEPTLSQAHMEQHLSSGMELRNGLTSWIENARSKLGMHGDEDARRSQDKTTDNRGGPESTSDAVSMQQDSISLQQNSAAMSNSSMPRHSVDGAGRACDPSQVLMERRDSVTSSIFATTESRRSVAQRLLEDLARMTKDAQAGRNVIECLLRYLDKGGHWANSSSLRNTAIGITRKVCAEEHQRYLLFSSLLRHTSSSGTGVGQQVALVELAAAEGRGLEGGLASPALVLAIKDLTPILPDPAVQNAGQLSLRKAILQCISDLARRVGDSLHLLEALGGVVGKLLGPAPLTTAVLECVAAAAVAVNFFPAKARALPSRTFPQVFLHHMMGMCASWQVPQRLLVHSCLVTLLPVATDGLKDTQVHGLLSTIWHEVAIQSNPPGMFASLDALLAAGTAHCSPAALLNTLRMVMSLREDVLDGSSRLSGLSSAQCCAVLLLFDASLARLAAALSCDGLLDVRLPIPPEVCPQLRISGVHDLHLVSETGFSQVDERAAGLTLQRARQTQQGHRGMQSIAELLCSQSSMQQSFTDGNLWEAACKLFLPLPLAALQPKIKAAGGRAGSPTGADNSSRAMQRLKDMYARNSPTHEHDRAPQPQGVKQLLQASMALAEQETLEDDMTTSQERHYMNVAAECKVSHQALQHVLEDIELTTQPNHVPAVPASANIFELLPHSGIHRLGLGVHDLSLLHV